MTAGGKEERVKRAQTLNQRALTTNIRDQDDGGTLAFSRAPFSARRFQTDLQPEQEHE